MWNTILYRTLQKLTCSKPINDTVPVHCQDGEQSFANTPRPNCDDISIMCLISIVPYIFKFMISSYADWPRLRYNPNSSTQPRSPSIQ